MLDRRPVRNATDGLASSSTTSWRVVHGCGLREPRQLCQQRRDPGLVAEQQKTRGGVALEGDIGALQHHRRRAVAAHRVEGDGDAAVHRVTVRALHGAAPSG